MGAQGDVLLGEEGGVRTVCRRQKERQLFFLRILIDRGAQGILKAMDTVSLGPSTD